MNILKILLLAGSLVGSSLAGASDNNHVVYVKSGFNYLNCVKRLERETSTQTIVVGGNSNEKTIFANIGPSDMSKVISFRCVKSVEEVKTSKTTINSSDAQKLISLMSDNAKLYGGINMGWSSYGAVVRCYSPDGTGNQSDAIYCELEPVK